MSLAHDNTVGTGGTVLGTILTYDHVITGSNLVLLVSVYTKDYASSNHTSVSYNGVALTKIESVDQGTQGHSVWRLENPATGTHSVVVTLGVLNAYLETVSISLTGYSATDGHNNKAATSASTISDSYVTTVDNCWLVDFHGDLHGQIPTPGGSQTIRYDGVPQGELNFCSTQSVGAAGSQTMSWSGGSGVDYVYILVALQPVVTTTTSTTTTTTSSSTSSTTSSSTTTTTSTTSTSSSSSSTTTHSTSTTVTTTSTSTTSTSSSTSSTTTKTTSTTITTTSSSTTHTTTLSSSTTTTVTTTSTSTTTTVTPYRGLTFAKRTDTIITTKEH